MVMNSQRKNIITKRSINPKYFQTNFVYPVINFTIRSPAGAMHFESEAVSIFKDGKERFCFLSRILSQKCVRKQEEVNSAVEDEDEEWRDEPDNPEGDP